MSFDVSNIKFGRLPQVADYRDRRLADYITPTVRERAARTASRVWPVSRVLDQGATNHCVGYAWAGFGIALPVYQDWQASHGEAIYYAAKKIDGDPTGEGGTYTRSGVRAFMQFSRLQDSSYAWAGNINDVVTWVLAVGPVVTGTRWYSGMLAPDASGLVKISGGVAGGHEWLINGADQDKQLLHAVNSWGTGWADGGKFRISFSDYARLLSESGDAVTATEVGAEPEPSPSTAHRWKITRQVDNGAEETIVEAVA